MTSPDGITWTSRNAAASNGWFGITYGNGLFVAVSYSGDGNRVMTSPDGITWTSRTSPANNDWYGIAYGNGLFVAVAGGGSGNRVMTSSDGITWTSQTSVAINYWVDIAYANGIFVAVAFGGNGNRVMRFLTTLADTSDQVAALAVSQAKAAAAQREAEKRNARAEILAKYKKSESISIELFAQAEIAGITKENIVEVQAEIAASPEVSREDITHVLKVARKFEVVGMVASDRVVSIYSNSLIEIGLISADSKHKAALTEAIKNLPVDERTSYAAIKVAIDAEMAEIQARKDRLTAILARIAAHRAS